MPFIPKTFGLVARFGLRRRLWPRAAVAPPPRGRRAEALGLRYEGHLRGLIRPARPPR